MPDTEPLTAIYNPDTGKIGCVLIQAGHGADKTVASLFDTSDWELAPTDGQQKFTATLAQWKFIVSMTAEERVRRFSGGRN